MRLLLILVVVFICVTTVDCQENTEEKKCLEQLKKGIKVPFYYGDTNLACVKKMGKGKKRRSLSEVSTIRLVHRFVYYCGWYFEFVDDDADPVRTSPMGPNCNPEVESEPAGSSNVRLDCAKNCARKWSSGFRYHTLSNNCHHFANTMARFLYKSDGECCNN